MGEIVYAYMSTNYLTARFLLLGRERTRGGEIEAFLGEVTGE